LGGVLAYNLEILSARRACSVTVRFASKNFIKLKVIIKFNKIILTNDHTQVLSSTFPCKAHGNGLGDKFYKSLHICDHTQAA